MDFDATVTIGNVLTIVGLSFAVLSAIIWMVGSKYFPSKQDFQQLREHVAAQVVGTRTDVETAVRKMEVHLDKEIRTLTEVAKERFERQCADWSRLEAKLDAAVTDVREARDRAREADHRSVNTEKTMDAGITRLERAVETLLSRKREV